MGPEVTTGRNPPPKASSTYSMTNTPMHERYKPAAGDFTLCEEGRLLIISPAGLYDILTRSTCMAMNTLAHDICTHHHPLCF